MSQTTPPPSIKMIAFNPLTRRYETVDPESEVTLEEMRPRFYCQALHDYVSVPGVTAADVYTDWLRQA